MIAATIVVICSVSIRKYYHISFQTECVVFNPRFLFVLQVIS